MPTTPRALLAEIIDYAGLFPPARLPMDEALSRFLSHRAGGDGWLLARFVCPASRLGELTSLVENADLGQTPVRVAALGAGGDDPPSFADAMERDLAAMDDFSRHHEGRSLIDVFEVKLPASGEATAVIDFVCDQLQEGLANPIRAFFELSLLDDWRSRLETGLEAIAAASDADPDRRTGLKIRCGGLDAAAVPTVEAVAGAVITARNEDLPLKATQGLHHPFRHQDPSLGATAHGFFNLLAASIHARAHNLDEATVREIIADEDPGSFGINEYALRWRDLETEFEGVADGRLTAFTGFGSCSFAEPRDDLSNLELLRSPLRRASK